MQIQLISFQCSLQATSEGIIGTFNQASKLQEQTNLDDFASVVVLDEIGLAEGSPKLPLKVRNVRSLQNRKCLPILTDMLVGVSIRNPYTYLQDIIHFQTY